MKNCASCGSPLQEGMAFCGDCGAPVAINDGLDAMTGVDPIGGNEVEIGASLESAVQANQEMIASMEERADAAVIEAARLAEAEAAAMADAEFADPQGYVPPSYDGPTPPAEYDAGPNVQAGVGAAGVGVAAGAAGAAAAGVGGASNTPFYQQDVSPNAHYSSQRSYADNSYGYDTGQPGYRQPSYGQGASNAQEQQWPPQTNTNKAFAMTLYVAGLLGVIFALLVRDRDDEFITHHLNNCVVILIGALIGTLLSVVVIGFLLLIYLVVMTIMGIVSAYNGDMKELPLISQIRIVK